VFDGVEFNFTFRTKVYNFVVKYNSNDRQNGTY